MVSGNLSAAINVFVAAIKKNPNDVKARRYLAHCLAVSGDPHNAVKQFRAMASLEAISSANDIATFADVCSQVGDSEDMVRLHEKLLRLDPSNHKYRLGMARAYAAVGNRQQLQTICSTGIRLAGSDAEAAQFSDLLNSRQSISTNLVFATIPALLTTTVVSSGSVASGAVTPVAMLQKQTPVSGQKLISTNNSKNAWEGFKGLQKTLGTSMDQVESRNQQKREAGKF
jgi:protein involved in temperature-dependent protein secretion